MFCSSPTTDAFLAPPQDTQAAASGTVRHDTDRAQLLDEVDAYVAELQARLDEMMGAQ